MQTLISNGWIGSGHLATSPDLPWCHVSMHEQTASVTLWCAAISSPPSMHEQLKDFPPQSIIMNCKLIDCDKRLSHQPSSPDAKKTFHLTQVHSPWPRATSSEVGWVTSSVAFKTANQRDLNLDWSRGGYGEFTLSRLAQTRTTAVRVNLKEERKVTQWELFLSPVK